MPIQPKTSNNAIRVAEDAHLVFEARLLERHAAVLDLLAGHGADPTVRAPSRAAEAAARSKF